MIIGLRAILNPPAIPNAYYGSLTIYSIFIYLFSQFGLSQPRSRYMEYIYILMFYTSVLGWILFVYSYIWLMKSKCIYNLSIA